MFHRMVSFRHLSIKHKLTLLSVLTSGSALALACAAFVAYDGVVFRDTLVQNIATQAKIVGINSAAALLFNEAGSATETLAALRAEPNIVSASIYTAEGKLFASYARNQPIAGSATELPQDHRLQPNYLALSQPIVLHREPIGIVSIRADLEPLRVRQKRYLIIAGVVLVIFYPRRDSDIPVVPAAHIPPHFGPSGNCGESVARQRLCGSGHGREPR